MITEETYRHYVEVLLHGDSGACLETATRLLSTGSPPEALYIGLLQRSLYHIGELWEQNRISVATEHLASAITERILAIIYPVLLTNATPHGRRAIISCSVNEYHQIGARMIADLMESRGWDASFLGANTPVDDLLAIIDQKSPEFLGLSVSIYFNMAELHRLVETIRVHYSSLNILLGGQAFRWGGADIGKNDTRIAYVPSLTALDALIGND